MNVLMYLDDPQACLSLIYEGLAPDGVLALSVPNEGANLDHLFSSLRSDLEAKGKFDELRGHYDNVYDINRRMDKNEQLSKYTVAELETMIKKAGFSNIIAQDTEAYAGQAIFMGNDGTVAWMGWWTTSVQTRGLFVDYNLVVETGVTKVGGLVIEELSGLDRSFTVSDSGQYLLFEAVLEVGIVGAFLIDLWD